ncbi:AEC family transporter [Komagataeibacter sp. NFXK3]
MLSTIIAAMLPLIVVFVLGYRAGWHHDFDGTHVAVLNRLVMLYAFPLNLFVGIARMPRTILAGQMPLAASVFGLMCASFAVAYGVSRYVARRGGAAAALQGLAIGAPSVPFIGSAMLPVLIGHDSTAVAISAAVFAMVLVQTPVCMMMLGHDATVADGASVSFVGQVGAALKEPIVWAPLLATALVALDVHIPRPLLGAMGLLGNTATGVALFASGVVLFLQRVHITLPVVMTVLARNIVVPAGAWLVLVALGLPHDVIRATVLTLSIPVGTVVVILAVRFKTDEQEAASTLFLSAVASVLTMVLFILLTAQH